MESTWRRLPILVGALLAGALTWHGASAVGAQQPTPPAWVQLNVVQIHPDMDAEFMSIQKAFSERAKERGTPFRSVFRTAQLGDTWRYLIATPMDSLAELDDAGETDAGMSQLIERARRCIVSRQSYAVRPVASASHPLPLGTSPKLAVTEFVQIAPGRGSEYLAVLGSDVLPHFETAKVPYLTGRLTLGGTPGFVHFFMEDSFAEIEKGSPVARALGPEGAEKVEAKMAGIVTHVEVWVSRFLPEVSYDTRAGTSNDN